MTTIIIEYNDENIKQETINDLDIIFPIWAMAEYFKIDEKCYGKILHTNYEENIIYTDRCRITFISDNEINTENIVIFKPISKDSEGYLYLIEDAEYTIDFLYIEDNLVYLVECNNISFHASDFINKNTKLRITESDKEDEQNFEKYNDDTFSIDDNNTVSKYPETSSFIENQYNSCISEINEISFKIIEKQKQKAILDKEISDLETNILDGRKMKKKFEIMLNELKQ